MKQPELAALKANYATLIRGMAPIELNRLAQNAIDDGSMQSIVLLDCIRVENFGRKHKDDRAFENAALLQLIRVAEHDQAQPLLQQVIDHYNVAYAAWADFSGKANRATWASSVCPLKLKSKEKDNKCMKSLDRIPNI